MATITCRDCGEIRENCPKNTVLCRECRTKQQIQHALTQQLRKSANSKDDSAPMSSFAVKRTCSTCDDTHTPYRSSDLVCPSCYAAMNPRFQLEEDCPCCRKSSDERYAEAGVRPVRLFEDIPICNFCFSSPNVKYRKAIVSYLADRQLKRAKENNYVAAPAG